MERYHYFLDAEFQSYLINRPINEAGLEEENSDPLLQEGFTPESTITRINVDVDGVVKSFNQYLYQFILSIGILIISPTNERSYRFTRFPLFIDDGAFSNPRILVPNYTFAGEGQAELRATFESLQLPPFEQLAFGDFPSLDRLTVEQQATARHMFQIYSDNLSYNEKREAFPFLTQLALENNKGNITIVTQGISDMNALKNTYFKYKLKKIRPFPHKDITPICKYYKKTVPLENAKLVTVKNYIVNETSLVATEAEILSEISAYMTGKYARALGDLAAHNPLVDSMYVYLVLAGYKRKEAADPLAKEIKTHPGRGGRRVRRKSTRRMTKKRRITRRR